MRADFGCVHFWGAVGLLERLALVPGKNKITAERSLHRRDDKHENSKHDRQRRQKWIIANAEGQIFF
jgi:hypothetical protein